MNFQLFKYVKDLDQQFSEDIPKFLADLIIKCWDAKAENRPTAKELSQMLEKWNSERMEYGNEICSQMNKYEEIRENNLENRSIKISLKIL